jgi:glycosyltransferase involved in cell wall biosynthesis
VDAGDFSLASFGGLDTHKPLLDHLFLPLGHPLGKNNEIYALERECISPAPFGIIEGMVSSPLFSIVIPSFNQGAFLEECLRSVLDQSYPRKEIIVMDGGSMDSSREILRKYERRLDFWISEPDRGQADAVNKGWARAKGEVLGWLNSDDRLEAGALEAAAAAYAAQPGAAILYGDVQEIDHQGKVLGEKKMAGYGLRSLLLGKNMGQPGVFIPRTTYAAVGGLTEELHFALDFDFFLRVWTAFPEGGAHIPKTMASSRVWEASKTLHQGERFGEEYRRVLEKYFANENLPPEIKALHRKALSRSVYFRQARIFLRGGKLREGLGDLMRAMRLEDSPLEAARLFYAALRALRERGRYAS